MARSCRYDDDEEENPLTTAADSVTDISNGGNAAVDQTTPPTDDVTSTVTTDDSAESFINTDTARESCDSISSDASHIKTSTISKVKQTGDAITRRHGDFGNFDNRYRSMRDNHRSRRRSDLTRTSVSDTSSSHFSTGVPANGVGAVTGPAQHVAQASLRSLLRPDAFRIIQQVARVHGDSVMAGLSAMMVHRLYDVVFDKMQRILATETDK